MAELKQGDFVISPKRPEWGPGTILELRADVAEVQFDHAGRKRITVGFLKASPTAPTNSVTSPHKADYERHLRLLVGRFLSIANRPGIEKIEPKIHEAFLGSGRGRSEVKRQLRSWVQTNPFGRHDQANEDAVALWNFLFPDEAV